jgi:hypothetical protein
LEEDGIDREGVCAVAGATFERLPEWNVSNTNDGLAVPNNERGWVLACVTVRVVVGEWVGVDRNVGAEAERFNRSGSM